MVKLQSISTPIHCSITCSYTSSDHSSSSSPTSPLPSQQHQPPLEFTKMPSLLPQSSIIPSYIQYPLHQPHMVLFQSYPPYYYYSTPFPVYFYPGQIPPSCSPYLNYPQTTPATSVAMDHMIRGPRSGYGVERKRVVKLNPRKGKTGRSCSDENVNVKMWKPKEKKKLRNPNSLQISTIPADLADCTTIMLKNIPNSLRNNLMVMLDRHCREQNGNKDNANHSFESHYDFLYLPFDFIRKQNLGYAFINFTTVEGASKLYTCWNNKGWKCCPKIRVITRAKLQGLAQCRQHFETSVFVCDSKEFLPLEFSPPRNGFNGDTCKVKTIGKLVSNGARLRKSSSHRGWRAKTIHPPRLNRSSDKC